MTSQALPTIAERHNLQRGDICEIWIEGIGGPRKHFGRYKFTQPDGRLYFDKGDLSVPLTFKPEKIRSVRKVTPAYVASQFHVGQWVVVRKYGGEYGGAVHAIGRTRLTVVFQTKAGKAKKIMCPAWQVMFS